MKIIAIEGIDKSGKATLAESLKFHFELRGLRVVKGEFHNYDSPTGELIRKWLTNEYPVDQLTIELIMAADKQAMQANIQHIESQGIDVLVLDRYILSQEVHALAKGVDPVFVNALQQHLRPADHTIIVDIPAEVSMSRKPKHNNGINDRYESDLNFLAEVGQLYRDSALEKDCLIDGTKTKDEILQEALRFLYPLIS